MAMKDWLTTQGWPIMLNNLINRLLLLTASYCDKLLFSSFSTIPVPSDESLINDSLTVDYPAIIVMVFDPIVHHCYHILNNQYSYSLLLASHY